MGAAHTMALLSGRAQGRVDMRAEAKAQAVCAEGRQALGRVLGWAGRRDRRLVREFVAVDTAQASSTRAGRGRWVLCRGHVDGWNSE